MIIGLYRVLVQHWQPADAYSEMLYFGFTPGLRELDDFYKNRTGWHPVFRAPIPQYQ